MKMHLKVLVFLVSAVVVATTLTGCIEEGDIPGIDEIFDSFSETLDKIQPGIDGLMTKGGEMMGEVEKIMVALGFDDKDDPDDADDPDDPETGIASPTQDPASGTADPPVAPVDDDPKVLASETAEPLVTPKPPVSNPMTQ